MLALSIKKLIGQFAKNVDPLGTTLVSSSIKRNKKNDKQLTLLKRTLASKQPLPSPSLYDEYHHRQIYKRIDTDIEAFFYKREYTLENFNFLVNLLGHQKKIECIPEVISKMQLMKIEPDQITYNYMIKAAAIHHDSALAQKYFNIAVQRFGYSKYFYTSLMQAYLNDINPDMAYKILQEMIEKGINPDLPVYTTLINSFRLGRKLQKCWELNKMIVKNKIDVDETYTGVMLKVHAATHDAEMAIKIYRDNIIAKCIKPMIQTTNSYFKALATRPQYSQQVIDQFFDMIENGEIVNIQTIHYALKAASTTANVKSAIEIVKIMKLNKFQPTKEIYNSLIRVYAKACDIPTIEESYRDIMLMDTWKILEQVVSKNMVDTVILNNVMLVYANSLKDDKIDGLILPLYEKFNLQMDAYTYQILVDMNYKKKDFNTALRVWEQMKIKFQERRQKEIATCGVYQTNLDSLRQDLRPTFNSLQLYIQMGIRLMDMHIILEGLQWFKKLSRHPKNSTLKFLGNLKNLPEQIVVSLMDFQIKFGAAKVSKTKKDMAKSIKDPQNR